jgi:ubiquinone biosynthesis protein
MKTLVVMEGVGKKLAPDFDVFAVSAPYVRQFLLQMSLPQSWLPGLTRSLGGWVTLMSMFPRQATRVLSLLERGELEIKVEVPALRQATREYSSATNRLVLAILLGAMVIALALLAPSMHLRNWPWSALTWLTVFGFTFVFVLAFWLIISMFRSYRRQ